MKTRRSKVLMLVTGYVVFFVTIAALIAFSVYVYVAAERQYGDDKGIVFALMLVTVLFLALVCTVIDGIRRKVTVDRPVENISDATARIASGDFSVRIRTSHPYGRYDEFDCIADNINTMAAELSKTKVLHTDFVSNVSHELKTPLAIIQNYSQAIKDGNPDKETLNKYADVLVATSKRLTALVTNILKLNRLENQQIRTEPKSIRLNEMLAESVLAFEDAIEAKGLELDCDLDELVIQSDPDYLEIVWSNLISNAIKFTEPNGKISVSLKEEGGEAVVKVSDTGIGISAETGRYIFDKFYQGDTSHAQEGNGLGLALVKKVIDVLGGEISVESQLGKGSTFIVRLRGKVA